MSKWWWVPMVMVLLSVASMFIGGGIAFIASARPNASMLNALWLPGGLVVGGIFWFIGRGIHEEQERGN